MSYNSFSKPLRLTKTLFIVPKDPACGAKRLLFVRDDSGQLWYTDTGFSIDHVRPLHARDYKRLLLPAGADATNIRDGFPDSFFAPGPAAEMAKSQVEICPPGLAEIRARAKYIAVRFTSPSSGVRWYDKKYLDIIYGQYGQDVRYYFVGELGLLRAEVDGKAVAFVMCLDSTAKSDREFIEQSERELM